MSEDKGTTEYTPDQNAETTKALKDEMQKLSDPIEAMSVHEAQTKLSELIAVRDKAIAAIGPLKKYIQRKIGAM